MNASKDTLVLFQINNKLIASANLESVEKFDEEVEGLYKGAYFFDIDSIKVFDPINARELAEIDKSFKSFSQVKQRIDSSKYDQILSLINSKEKLRLAEEIIEPKLEKYFEGSKQQIAVNAYERNPKARRECIRIHGHKCLICGFDFEEV